MLSKLMKIGSTLLLSMVLLLSSSFSVFAAPISNSDIPVTPTNQAVLTTPDGNKILIDSISFENGLEDKTLKTSLQSNIVRNRVVINKNSTTPVFSYEEGGPTYENSSFTLSKSYLNSNSLQWLDVSKSQQEAIYKKLIDSNRIFVKWKNTCEYTVESASPISITYSVGNGEKKTERISCGTYTFTYYSIPGDSTIWSGYLTYNSGTSMFNGGVNFLKN